MSQRAIREYDGKVIISNWLSKYNAPVHPIKCVQVTSETDISKIGTCDTTKWVNESTLVAKPDCLIKRRGKSGLIALNQPISGALSWVQERMDKQVDVDGIKGVLNSFIIEPFLPHAQENEYYVCIYSTREGDVVLFHHEGGVDVGDVDAKATKIVVPVLDHIEKSIIINDLIHKVPQQHQQALAQFIVSLYTTFKELHFSYLEINPLVAIETPTGVEFAVLDLAAKLDEAASFEVGKHWAHSGTPIDFPSDFGLHDTTPEEAKIKELDSKTGASLKLQVLNAKGRIWLMTAGGGASVIMADTVADYGYGHELANYGEYSGAPTTQQTFEYANCLLSLMTKEKHEEGKLLLISGGIANFTDVAATFKGIIQCLTKYRDIIIDHGIRIFVRRGGPNYQEGLQLMRTALMKLGLEVNVFGPETHMTSIIPMALGLNRECNYVNQYVPGAAGSNNTSGSGGNSLLNTNTNTNTNSNTNTNTNTNVKINTYSDLNSASPLFTPETRSVVYGLQTSAVQNMLDFDFICGREKPSVACLVYPFQQDHYVKLYWNSKEILLPCYQSLSSVAQRHPDVDTVVNFASFRSVYESTIEMTTYPQFKTIAIIAEGVPERRAREIMCVAQEKNIHIIGPATVGGIKPGCFRIGNAGGMLDNIISSRLYRAGSVAYVTRSGGMSNEMNNIINNTSDGVYEGVAIGGDRYPGSTFIDHLKRYQADDNVKMMVLLGEVGGVEEYTVCEMLKNKEITKPIIAWCVGTVAKIFTHNVQFGHAGACANAEAETAEAKNNALKEAGAIVPPSFDKIGVYINQAYSKLVESGVITVKTEIPPPAIPVDYNWARKLGLVRKPSSFISSICDERGKELTYNNVPISTVISSEMGIGGVIGLLWFKKNLPKHFCNFIEVVLQLTADHGPAVSGAHNTIVAARAGKDLISSLCSGLLTIGPRFGGALDDAARLFSAAVLKDITPDDFVTSMRKKNILISGIGHKVKSLEDPDSRVALLKKFVKDNMSYSPFFDFACQVELITTKKKSNLILNVDGAVAVIFLDLMRENNLFSEKEMLEYVDMGILNGLFVVGRSIGFVGHFIDQNRFKQGLYRHPTDDITYADV